MESLVNSEFPMADEALENKAPRLKETPETGKPLALEPVLRRDVPNCKKAWVTGDPFGMAHRMNYDQSKTRHRAYGTCGLVSISNSLTRLGYDIPSDDIVCKAITTKRCQYRPLGDPNNNGGTNLESRKALLHDMGFKSEIGRPHGKGGDLEDIADAIDRGCGVVLSLNAGALWNTDIGVPALDGRPRSNHCVAVTGVARDAATGEVVGIYIADSGRGRSGDACRYLDREKFNEVYMDVVGSGVNIIHPNAKEVRI